MLMLMIDWCWSCNWCDDKMIKWKWTSKKSLFFLRNCELISNREIENSQISLCNIQNHAYIDFEHSMNYQKLWWSVRITSCITLIICKIDVSCSSLDLRVSFTLFCLFSLFNSNILLFQTLWIHLLYSFVIVASKSRIIRDIREIQHCSRDHDIKINSTSHIIIIHNNMNSRRHWINQIASYIINI